MNVTKLLQSILDNQKAFSTNLNEMKTDMKKGFKKIIDRLDKQGSVLNI